MRSHVYILYMASETSASCTAYKYEPLPEFTPPIPEKRHQPCSNQGKELNKVPYNVKTRTNKFNQALIIELNIGFGEMVEAAAPLKSKDHFKIEADSMQLGIRG